MKKHFGILLLFAFSINFLQAQKWQKVGQGSLNFPNGAPAKISIDKLYPISTTTIVAYGYNTLIITTDGGNTWTDKSPSHEFHIYKVHFFDSIHGVAVGDSIYPDPLDPIFNKNHRGLILKTYNGGDTWHHYPNTIPQERKGFLSSDFIDSNTFFVSAYSPVYKTTDGGKTYTDIIWANDVSGNGFSFLNDSVGVARTMSGPQVLYSEDGFKTHTDSIFRDPFDNNMQILLRKMYFEPGKKTGFIITANGGITRTVNSGKSWLGGRYGQEDDETDFSFVDAMNGWKVSKGNKVYRYVDASSLINSWILDTLGLNDSSIKLQNPSRVAMVNAGLGYMVNKFNENIYNIYRYTASITGNNLVAGKVYIDRNTNNLFDSLVDIPLRNMTLLIQPGNYFSSTDINGNYEFNLPIGNYTVELLLPTGMANRVQFISPTSGLLNVSVLGNTLNTQKNFVLKGLNNSPYLSTTISSNRRRRCFSSVTVVNYSNTGFGNSQNTTIKVKLPQYILLDSTSINYTVDAEGNYLFNVGTVPPFSSGSIILYDRVQCGIESIRGLTVCTEAYITGDGVNYKTDTTAWDSTETIVNAKCLNGWINFQVINTSNYNMPDSLALRFYSNAMLADTKRYKLKAKDTLNLTIKADFKTYRLEADQNSGHPLSKFAQATIEGCEGEGQGTIDKGYVNKLPVNDFRLRKYVDCQEITDSYDPNDKSVTPLGFTTNNYVKPNTPLHYKIRFQNTGTDTAYKVEIVDTLSAHLDITSLQTTGASHPYTQKLTGTQSSPILTITFNNIFLPDSNTNEPASNGFVTYLIQPKKGIKEGTQVNNTAHIYFDFNSAITTNTTQTTIKDTTFSNPAPVNPKESLPFIVKSYTQDSICKGDSFTLAIIGYGPYKWYEASNPTTILSTSFELKLAANQTTAYIGQTQNGQAIQAVLVKNCTNGNIGIEPINTQLINIYPNPSVNGIFTIDYITQAKVDVYVTDLSGRKAGVIEKSYIDLSAHPAGIYIAQITANGKTYYQKLLKQ